ELLFLRFLLASLLGLPLVFYRWGTYSMRRKFKLSFLPAASLIGLLILQTWGLKYTTPTKSGFITTLYVVFVPLMEAAIARRRIQPMIWLCVLTALVGTGLIVDIGVSPLNLGDALTFASALIATLQIYWVGSVSPLVSQPFVFNIYQCFWSVLMVAP